MAQLFVSGPVRPARWAMCRGRRRWRAPHESSVTAVMLGRLFAPCSDCEGFGTESRDSDTDLGHALNCASAPSPFPCLLHHCSLANLSVASAPQARRTDVVLCSAISLKAK